MKKDSASPILRNALFIFFLALCLRLAWALLAPHLDPFLASNPLLGDAGSYDLIARSLLQGSGHSLFPPQPDGFWPPLYPYFLSIWYALLGYNLQLARLAQAFLGALAACFFFLIAASAFKRPVALLAGLGLAIYPYLVYFGAWLIAEALFLALFAAALWLLSLAARRWQVRYLLRAGVLLGLSALAKPTTLFFMPFIALWLFLAPENIPLRRRAGQVFLLALVTLVVILPWSFRNLRVFGQFVLISTNGGYTFLGANNPDAWGGHNEGYPALIPGLNDAEMEDVFYARAFDWIRSDPQAFLRLAVQKYRRLLSPLSVASSPADFSLPAAPLVYGIYFAFLGTSLAGLVLSFPAWRKIGYLYAPILGVFVSAGLYYGDARYTLPMAPSMVILAALAGNQALEAWHRTPP